MVKKNLIAGLALGLGLVLVPTGAGAAECVPSPGKAAVADTYKEVPNPDYVPAVDDSYTYERTTEWATNPPEGEGWYVVDTRTIEATYEWEYTRQVPNPDYKAPWTQIVEHEAEYETVEHPAEYATEHLYKKQVKTVRTKGNKTEVVHDWQWWSPVSAKWSEQDVAVLESGDHAEWKERGWNYDRDYRYVKTGETRQGRMTKEPSTEQVKVKDAWTETIEHPAEGGEPTIVETAWGERYTFDRSWTETGESRIKDEAYDEFIYEKATLVPGTPAQGEPTIEVIDVPGTPAVDPVICTPEPPKVTPVNTDLPDEPKPIVRTLAQTDTHDIMGLVALGAGSLLAGAGVLVYTGLKRRREIASE